MRCGDTEGYDAFKALGRGNARSPAPAARLEISTTRFDRFACMA